MIAGLVNLVLVDKVRVVGRRRWRRLRRLNRLEEVRGRGLRSVSRNGGRGRRRRRGADLEVNFGRGSEVRWRRQGEVRRFPGIDLVLHDAGEGSRDRDVFFRLEDLGLGELWVGRGGRVLVARRLVRERTLGFEQSRRIILSRVVRRRRRQLLRR